MVCILGLPYIYSVSMFIAFCRDWQAYHSTLGKLHHWYREIGDEIKAYEVSTAALQKIRSLSEQAKVSGFIFERVSMSLSCALASDYVS